MSLAGMLALSRSLLAVVDSRPRGVEAPLQQAVRVGDGLHPEMYLPRLVQADFWTDYGRGLARVRGRRDDAIVAFQRSEEISPHRIWRDPLTKDVITELLIRSRRDSVSRELRRMAYRAGLPV